MANEIDHKQDHKQDNKQDVDTYFIIERRKINYPKEHFSYYLVKDTSFDLTQATRMLLAYDTINDDKKTKSYHLQKNSLDKVA